MQRVNDATKYTIYCDMLLYAFLYGIRVYDRSSINTFAILQTELIKQQNREESEKSAGGRKPHKSKENMNIVILRLLHTAYTALHYGFIANRAFFALFHKLSISFHLSNSPIFFFSYFFIVIELLFSM